MLKGIETETIIRYNKSGKVYNCERTRRCVSWVSIFK